MKKQIKTTLQIMIGLTAMFSPIGILLASSSNNSQQAVVGQGSSSIKPIMQAITKKTYYSAEYTSNGSGKGFESQIANKPLSAFGMTSSLKYPKKIKDITIWKSNKIRTVTFAIDAISIVLNLPDGIKYSKEVRPQVDIKELSKLYDDDLNTSTTWRKLLTNVPGGSTYLDRTPIAYGREGGKKASGTSDGFWHTLRKHMADGLKPDFNHMKLPKNQQTPEANSQSLKIVQEKEGSLTYISLGYALNNESANSLVATITNVGRSNWIPSIRNVKENSYKWTRPFNIIYSTKNKKAINFTSFLLSPTAQEVIEESNFVPLSIEQIREQIPLNYSDEDRKADFTTGKNIGLGF